jgi:hypothetical protein
MSRRRGGGEGVKVQTVVVGMKNSNQHLTSGRRYYCVDGVVVNATIAM